MYVKTRTASASLSCSYRDCMARDNVPASEWTVGGLHYLHISHMGNKGRYGTVLHFAASLAFISGGFVRFLLPVFVFYFRLDKPRSAHRGV